MLRLFCFISLCWVTFFSVAQDAQVAPEVSYPPDIHSDNLPDVTHSAKEWLDRLKELVSNNNFEARFVVYRIGGDAAPYLWRHGLMSDGPDMEQLNLQNGPGKEFIRVGDRISVFEPDTHPYSVFGESINGPIPWALLKNQSRLYDAYQFILVGRSRVAGKPAKQIRVVSEDGSRYSYQIWLDEESGMLLKMNMTDSQGNVLEQIQMLGFSVTSQPHNYFSKVNNEKLPRVMSQPDGIITDNGWEVGYLPKGMQEVSQEIRRLAETNKTVEHHLYSDGLVDVSVYLESVQASFNKDFALRNGVTTFLSRVVNGAQVTVIGEIPPQTAQAIAASVKRK